MTRKLNSFAVNRRAFLADYCGGIGGLALAHLLQNEASASSGARKDPLAAVAPRRAGRAKSVICLFQHGGPSQMDLFDAKPQLTRHNGEPYPGKVEVHFAHAVTNLLASPFKFQKHGQCGMELSELLPHTAGVADELTLVRSMTTTSVDHESALRLIHTGTFFAGKPSLGSWVVYGLGSMRQELPAYVVLGDPGGLPVDGTKNWSAGYLPAVYQGTSFRPAGSPVLHLQTPAEILPEARQRQLDFLRVLNAGHLRRHPANSELEARITNYELAAKMQSAVPEALDVAQESKETHALYGLDQPATEDYGRRCLVARRLVERGVRFVQVFLSGQPWDTHSNNAKTLGGLCAKTDQPSAALVRDLKQRGLLDSTIVLWTGEFGRQPVSQGTDGRDHNRRAFSLWLAGGGFKRGYVHGATDDFGYEAVKDVVRVHDLHATLLDALGLDHERLTYPHDGRDDSLTDSPVTNAEVIESLLA
ncbi:MAG TPA: DUF1501 domain-containing protein [Planctomycetaceae bacterium]|jgi:hypothetical protein|nr:DUF1501 domain-containing protein [Planctomycetaceae bacterium]